MDNDTLALIQEIRTNLRTFNLSESALDKLISKMGYRPATIQWMPVPHEFLVSTPPAVVAPNIPAVSPINPMS